MKIQNTENITQLPSELIQINKLLEENPSSKEAPGLLHGKMGLGIYSFLLARETNDPEYQSLAEKCIGEVYETVGNVSIPADFENGLAGIAWGLCHLIKNDYVEADPDEILEDVDDRIYRYWNENKEKLSLGLRQGLLGYLSYYIQRLEISLDQGDDVNRYIHSRVASEIINRMGQLVEEEKFHSREPILFTLFWDLPILLMLLAKARRLKINPDKIDRIFDFLTPIIASLYPRLHSNRMYLLLGLESVLKKVSLSALRSHADLLSENISLPRIIDEECKNLNILAIDGVTGLAFISRKLAALTGRLELLLPREKVIQKIRKSVFWEDTGFHKDMKKNTGLIAGLSGMGILLLEYVKENHRIKAG